AQMLCLNVADTVEIGDGACDLKDSRISARAEAQAVDCKFQQAIARRFNLTKLAQFPRSHLRVTKEATLTITGELNIARSIDPFANRCRRFSRGALSQFAIFDRRNFDMNIDTVEQRSGNPRPITLDDQR